MKQSKQVVPPIASDRNLANFSQIIQSNLSALFQAAHVHKIVTSAPAANEGNIGDVYLGDLPAGKKLYVKFSAGWYEIGLTKV